MSNANKEIAKKFIHAMGSGDVATIKALITPDMTIVTRGHSAISMTHQYDAILKIAQAIGAVTEAGIEFRILNLTAEENRVAFEADGYATMKDGRPYNNHYHFLILFRDGKVCAMREYLDTKLAEAVLGPYLAAA